MSTLRGAAIAARLTIAAMWCLVACGPLALIMTTAQHAKPSPSSSAGTAQTAAQALGPAGFAQLYVTTYLRSGGTGGAVQAFLPGAQDAAGQSGSRQVTATTVAAVTELSPDYWSVLVAADEATAGLHYFQVPVVSSGTASSPSYVATALPAEVAAPAQAAGQQLSYDTSSPLPQSPLTSAVTQFLAAYLTGSGNLSRYLAPAATITAVSPAPYSSIGTVAVYTQDGTASGGQVLAQVQATDKSGQRWPLTYALTLARAAGQWDVSALDPAPALAARLAKGPA